MRTLTFKNKTMSVKDWAESIGVTVSCLSSRLAYGWSVERALTKPPIIHKVKS